MKGNLWTSNKAEQPDNHLGSGISSKAVTRYEFTIVTDDYESVIHSPAQHTES